MHPNTWNRQAVGLLLALASLTSGSGRAAQPARVDYLRDIKPILQSHCCSCHGALRQKAGLRLDTAALLRKGGDNGPALVPHNSGDSLLIDAITGNGKPPSHPELLDFQAVELMDSGWSMKKLHRLIVTSRAYRLQSGAGYLNNPSLAHDPDNRLSGGYSHVETFDPKPALNKYIHATVLHLFGLDGRRLEVPGRKRLEIDRGQVIREILA